MSNFTLEQIQAQISLSIDNKYNEPHRNIKDLTDVFFNKIQDNNQMFLPKGNIYQIGYFVPEFQCPDSSHKSIYANGDNSYDIYERIANETSPTDIYERTLSYQDRWFYQMCPTFSNTIKLNNTIEARRGSRSSYELFLLDEFTTNDYSEKYAYFGIGSVDGSSIIGVTYNNFYIIRYKKSTKSIDKILFIKNKSKSQYLIDFLNNDWEIANPDATNYIFTDLTSNPLETKGFIILTYMIDNIERNQSQFQYYYYYKTVDTNGYIRLVVNGKNLANNSTSIYNSQSFPMRVGFATRLNIDPNTIDPRVKILNVTSQHSLYGNTY